MNTALFWERIIKSEDEDACWLWTGPRSRNGYGRWTACAPREFWAAHRLAWTLTNGPIPGDLHVLHRCDNPPCCNPRHLFLGTPLDNARDKIAKGRMRVGHVIGEHQGSAKLTDNAVREIRRLRLAGHGGREVAHLFGVSEQTICDIVKGRRWRHVA